MGAVVVGRASPPPHRGCSRHCHGGHSAAALCYRRGCSCHCSAGIRSTRNQPGRSSLSVTVHETRPDAEETPHATPRSNTAIHLSVRRGALSMQGAAFFFPSPALPAPPHARLAGVQPRRARQPRRTHSGSEHIQQKIASRLFPM